MALFSANFFGSTFHTLVERVTNDFWEFKVKHFGFVVVMVLIDDHSDGDGHE